MRVYLDTSVFSALIDEREPSRQGLTRAFWEARARFACVTSEVAFGEILDNRDDEKMRAMLELYDAVGHLQLTPAARVLSNEYISRHVFTLGMEDDALHVACATVEICPVILSWNFRHLVNQRRRLLVNLVNSDLGYQPVDILTPPEI